MEYNEKIKYLDIVIKNIENTEMFVIENILSKETKLSFDEINEIELDLISFGSKDKSNLYELLNPENKSTRWLKLTEEGEKLKSSEKGFEKYKKNLEKTPMTKFEKWSLLLIILTIIINLIQWNYSSTLKSDLESCTSELDSLKTELYSKENIKIENNGKTLNKSLETKKESE